MIETSCDGYIRIWNFHTRKLINKICIAKHNSLNSICLWDDNHIFVGIKNLINLVYLKSGIVVKSLCDKPVITMKKIIHLKYGQCLLYQGIFDEKIKLIVMNI